MSVDPRAFRNGLPHLGGPSVSVREVAIADAPALFELLTDPRVSQHISPPPRSVSAFEGFIAWAQRERALANGVCFGIVPHGLEQAVGIIQVRAQEPSFFTAEWGFAIGAAFWSTGVFPEAAQLVVRFAFESLRVHRLEARAVTQNGRGSGALQKLGAVPEAVLTRAFRTDKGYAEQLLWTLVAGEMRHDPDGRFSSTSAKDRIIRAIDDTRQQIARAPRSGEPGDRATLHPFWVTHELAAQVCATCGRPLVAGRCDRCV